MFIILELRIIVVSILIVRFDEGLLILIKFLFLLVHQIKELLLQ